MSDEKNFQLACPIPLSEYPTVLLAHGGGGTLTNALIDKMFLTAFDNPILREKHDNALLLLPQNKIAFTTDSYVVSPLFFPGGDIGSLAVHGTVNDLAARGARPLYMSAAFIIEEGLPMATLWKVVASLAEAARNGGVNIVTGDTKVVERGKADAIFINTSGIGVIEHDQDIGPTAIRPGDKIIINGDLGRHGMAIMAARQALGFTGKIESDSAPLAEMVLDLIDDDIEVHCLRDLTRGGLASALNELASTCGFSFQIEESLVPVTPAVQAFCEVLGLDFFHVANEGRLAAFVKPSDADKAAAIMRRHEVGRDAVIIGEVLSGRDGLVIVRSSIGGERILPMLSGEQLPRIC